MEQETRSRWMPIRNIGPFVLVCFTALIVYGLPAHGQQAIQGNNRAVDALSSKGTDPTSDTLLRLSAAAASPQCPPVQHYDPGMRMCMPIGETPKNNEIDEVTSQHGETTSPSPGPPEIPTAPLQCPPVQHWDPGMRMCMSGEAKPKTAVMFHLNQFMVYSSTSGPRGQSRLTGPGMWMLMYDNDLSPKNHLHVDVMGSPEQLTVGDKGTPQLLQTEHVDNMHAHDTIMAFEFRDVVTLGAGDKQQLTFLFAPRGEAAAGSRPIHAPRIRRGESRYAPRPRAAGWFS